MVAQRLLYCRYERPATRQYAEADAEDDMMSLEILDCASRPDGQSESRSQRTLNLTKEYEPTQEQNQPRKYTPFLSL